MSAIRSPILKWRDVLNRLRQPFNLNLPAQYGAVAALRDNAYMQQSIEINQQGMEYLGQGFAGLGLGWIPSKGNFITVDLKRDAMPAYEGLLSKGVIVRPVANYGMPEHLRISIGLPEENRRLPGSTGSGAGVIPFPLSNYESEQAILGYWTRRSDES